MTTREINLKLMNVVLDLQDELNRNHITTEAKITQVSAYSPSAITKSTKAMNTILLNPSYVFETIVDIKPNQHKEFTSTVLISYSGLMRLLDHPKELRAILLNMAKTIMKEQGFDDNTSSIGNRPRIHFFRPGTDNWVVEDLSSASVELRAYSDAIPLKLSTLNKYLKENNNETKG